jgi:hypothetical protein
LRSTSDCSAGLLFAAGHDIMICCRGSPLQKRNGDQRQGLA